MGTLLARLPGGLPRRRNDFLDKEWESLNQDIAARLLPEEHAARKSAQPAK
jgi:hypothetical protein